VAGGQRLAAETLRQFQQVVELHGLVAADAGDRRLAAGVAIGEIPHHGVAEACLAVQHVMRDVEQVGHAPGIMDVLAGAAGALAAHGGAVVVELQGGADHLMPLGLKQPGDDAAVHAAGHGDKNPHGRCARS
jgi:hypothetical protein